MNAKEEIEQLLALESQLARNHKCEELITRMETEEVEWEVDLTPEIKQKVFVAFLAGLVKLNLNE